MTGVVVPKGGLYLNTTSGLAEPGGVLDRLTQAMDARSANDMQLQGLAAGGIIPQSMAPPSGGILGQALSMFGLGGSGAQQPQPQSQQQPPSAPNLASGAPPQAMSYASASPGRLAGNGLASYIGTTAQKYGIDPMTALRVAQSEGGFAPATAGDAGSSFGPFQLHYASGPAGGGNSSPGLGDEFTKQTGLDARDPANAQQAIDFALRNAAQSGWGAFHGAAKANIGPWQGISRGQPNSTAPMPQATADGPQPQQQPPQALGFTGSQPPAAPASPPSAALGTGGAAPVAPASSIAGGGGAGALALPGGMTTAGLQAMIANPATRQEGLAIWQRALFPAITSVKPGEAIFRGTQYVGQAPSAPMDVGPGHTVVNPQTGAPIVAVPPQLEHAQTGTDAYGQPQFGAFNPQTGAARPFQGAPGVQTGQQPGDGPGAPPTGEAFLSTLPPALQGQVKAIAEGRAKMPPAGARSPMAMRLSSMVQQYDPTFDQANAEARFGTRESWAHGPVSQTLVAGNTAIQHLGDLSDAAEALQNSNSPTWNKIGQEFGNLTGGNVAGKQFANTLNDFTGELVKFYRGTGGSEHDIEAAKEALDPSQSPAQLHAGIQQQASLISGKVNALQDQWHQSMGPQAKDYPIIAPKSQAALDRISTRAAPQGQGAPAPAPLDQARVAIARGAPRAAVIQRLQSMGINPTGL